MITSLMDVRSSLKKLLHSKNTVLIIIVLAVILFFNFLNENFISLGNLRNIMISVSFVGVLCVGVTMLLIGGEVDLSTGAIASLGGVIVGVLVNISVPWAIALIITIILGALLGLINAMFINKLGIMGFITTIAMISVYQGIAVTITQGKPMQVISADFWTLGSTALWNLIPLPFVIMIVLMIAYSIVLSSTNFGRSVYMCGGNRRAARLCGINPKRISNILYINNGALAALSGAVLSSRMHAAGPTAGSSGSLDAITAVVLGGVSFHGGVGGMSGCLIGLLLIDLFNAGLTMVGFPSYWQFVVRGGVLILALFMDFVSTGARTRALKNA